MEKMRHRLDQGGYHDPQPLGRTKPSRGYVYEDLGRTEFKTSSSTNGSTFSRCQANLDDSTSEDDVDFLSLKHGSSPPNIPPTAHKTSKASHEKSQSIANTSRTPPNSSIRCRVKPHPNFRYAEQPDTKQECRPKYSTLASFHASNVKFTGTDMPPSNQLALQRSQKLPFRELGHRTSPLEELSPNRTKSLKKSQDKRELEPFPMQDGCDATKSESKSHKRPKKSKGKREPEPFPIHDAGDTKSELKSQYPKRLRRDPAAFPLEIPSQSHSSHRPLLSDISTLSPLRVQCSRSKETTARRIPQRFPLDSPSTQGALDGQEDEDDELALTDDDVHAILAYGATRPFPMPIPQSLQQSTNEASGSKRSAGDNNEQRVNKRSRPSLEPFDDFSSLSLEGEGYVDPSSICPYCDEPWPSAPSPTLLSLLERTKRKSYTDPRLGNALGLKAPLAVFIELCQRHRFEMTHLPLALERGWPTRLEFASLPKRIRGFKRQLKRFADHPNESQFWSEIRDDVKEVGRMKVVSVGGQYATFERTQPGYYGEQGSIIIHQTLYSLFPPDDMPWASVDPLTPDQFLTRVLVPETAVLLIQEDMHLSTKAEALRVLDDSKKYGLAMFPEQAQGEEAAEVGEQLARERAKERRKLLEERGEADADVKRQVEREHKLARKAKRSYKGQSAAKAKGTGTGKAQAPGSETEHQEEEEQDFRKGMRKADPFTKTPDFDKSVANVGPKRWNESRDVLMLDGPDQLTPRPLMEKTRESSIASRRSKRLPSTPPDTPANRLPSQSSSLYRSIHKPTSSPPRPPPQEDNQDTEWVFNLRNVSPSPDREDVDFNEMAARYEGSTESRKRANSYVKVMENDSTPKCKPREDKCSIVQRFKLGDSSDTDPSSKKATPQPKQTRKQKAEKRGDQGVGMTVALGQTKRKKKGTTKDRSEASDAEGSAHSSSWLLDDISE